MPQRDSWRTGRRLWPILLFALGVAAGCYALRLDLRGYSPLQVSPDGTKLLLLEYVDSSRDQRSWCYVLDLESNQVVCDFSEFGRPKYPSWRWCADGKSVYGIFQGDAPYSQPVELLQVDVSNPRPRILQRQTLDALDVAAVKMLDDGTVAYVSRHPAATTNTANSETMATRPYLRFVLGQEEVGRVEYGRDEYAGVIFYDDDPGVVRVMIHPSTANGATGDYVISDGTNLQLLQFDFATARELFRTTARYQNGPPLFHGSNAAVSLVNGKRRLVTAGRQVDSGASSTLIMNLLRDEDVIVVNEKRVVTVDHPNWTRLISIHGPTGGTPLTSKTVPVDYASGILPDREAENLIYSTDPLATAGRLMKLNLDTRRVEQMLMAQPWRREAAWLALAGWLAFPILWFRSARLSERPLLDGGIMLMVLLVGSLISLQFTVAPVPIWWGFRCLALAIAFSTVSLFILAWKEPAKRKWMSAMLIAAVSAALLCRDDMIADLLLGGFWTCWYLCGCVAMNVLLSRTAKFSDVTTNANRFSLRQIIVVTAVIAALLAAMRFYVAGQTDSSQSTQQHIVWILTAPFATAAITFAASHGALRIRNLWVAILAVLAAVVAFPTLMHSIARVDVLTPSVDRLEWWGLTILTAILLFAIYRHIRNQHQRLAVNAQCSIEGLDAA